jgi:3-oxoacyl-(acyl-carrier-protein) synthase
MSRVRVHAASYLGPAGHGNDRTGLRPWPADCAENFRHGRLAQLHWSLVFPSTPVRFARMDLMCRLGVLAVELLDAGFDALTPERRDRIGICVESCIGALGTDVQFLQTPRPTLFTYSLPSTVIGELCIRHQLRGPALCLIAPDTGGSTLWSEAADLIGRGDAEACLCLSCEALDHELACAAVVPGDLPQRGWHAGALLLSPAPGGDRQAPSSGESAVDLCQRLCRKR